MYNKNFPLYDLLEKHIKSTDLTLKEKQLLINNIENNLDSDGIEKIYLLIKYHYYKNLKNEDSTKIPFEGEENLNTFEFNLDKLPIKLKQIINKFVKIHIEKLEIDINRSSIEEKN